MDSGLVPRVPKMLLLLRPILWPKRVPKGCIQEKFVGDRWVFEPWSFVPRNGCTMAARPGFEPGSGEPKSSAVASLIAMELEWRERF